jgi:hypothetical protein
VPDRQVDDAMARPAPAERGERHVPRLGFGGQWRTDGAIDGAMPGAEPCHDRSRPGVEHALELDGAGPLADVPEVGRATVHARRAPCRPEAAIIGPIRHVVVGDGAAGRRPDRMQIAAAPRAGWRRVDQRQRRLRPIAGDRLAIDRQIDTVATLARAQRADHVSIEGWLEPQAADFAGSQIADGEDQGAIAQDLRDDRLAVVLPAEDEALADEAGRERDGGDGFGDRRVTVGDEDERTGADPARLRCRRRGTPQRDQRQTDGDCSEGDPAAQAHAA